MEQYKEEIGTLAMLILNGVDGDTAKATEGVKAINTILSENTKIIPFISDEKNRDEFKKLKYPKSSNPLDVVGFIGQLKALSKRYNES